MDELPVMRILPLVFVLLLGGSPAGAAPLEGDPTPPPTLDAITSPQEAQIDQFIREAMGYLERRPAATAASRVALDLYLAATLNRDERAVRYARERLVLDYPQSPFAAYCVAAFEAPEDYRDFLLDVARRYESRYSLWLARQWVRALQLGIKRHGWEFLEGDELLLYTALFAREANFDTEYLVSVGKLRSGGRVARQVARIVFDSAAPLSEQVLALSDMSQHRVVRFYQKVLFELLTPEEQQQPHLARRMARNYLTEQEFARAVEVLAAAAAAAEGEEEAQHIYWRAWALAALGRREESSAAVAQLLGQHPQSPWSRSAETLALLSAERDARIDAYADALLRVVERLKRGLEGLEGTFTLHLAPHRPAEVYLGLVPHQNYMEVQARWQNRLLLGYKTTADQSLLYFEGDTAIQHFLERGVFLIPQLNMTVDGARRVAMEFAMYFSPELDAVRRANRPLIESPMLSTRLGMRSMLDALTQQGAFPGAITEDGRGKTYTWHYPRWDTPEIGEVNYTVTIDDYIVAFQSEWLSCRQIRYGARDHLDLVTPEWPALPLLARKQFSAAAAVQLLEFAASLFGPVDDLADPVPAAEEEELPPVPLPFP